MSGDAPDADAVSDGVLNLSDVSRDRVRDLLARFGLRLEVVPTGSAIPGSYWGDREAGLSGRRLLAREDTPVHSVLHETCHYVCMSGDRRRGLDTDAGGDYDEENAVCYLQIVLADELAGVGVPRMQADMDRWGYTFRLGSARKWFEDDAVDAARWLRDHGVLDADGAPTWRLRQ